MVQAGKQSGVSHRTQKTDPPICPADFKDRHKDIPVEDRDVKVAQLLGMPTPQAPGHEFQSPDPCNRSGIV